MQGRQSMSSEARRVERPLPSPPRDRENSAAFSGAHTGDRRADVDPRSLEDLASRDSLSLRPWPAILPADESPGFPRVRRAVAASMSFSVLHSWITPDVEDIVALSRSPIIKSNLHLLPSRLRHRLALILPGRGDGKVGGESSCRAGGEPRPCFLPENRQPLQRCLHPGRRRSAKSIQPFSLKAALIHDLVLSFRDWNASWTNWPYSLKGRIMGCSLTNGSKSCRCLTIQWRDRRAM